MAGTGGASMAENEGSCCDSENGNKRLKSGEEEEEDRFSALPDLLIQHILSLLPATDLVKTCVLSKWWQDQWTRVPVLEFAPKRGMSADNFSNFNDKTLILLDDSPNIDKFHINIRFSRDKEFPNLDSWIHFALRKNVKELIVNFNDDIYRYSLPQFLFNNSSLVKLKLSHCNFWSTGKVHWESVKILRLEDCALENEAMESILSGTPLLENLELWFCDMNDEEFVVASNSLKTLVMDSVGCDCNSVEISCPNLERLRVSGLVWFTSLELVNLPSSVYATLDFFLETEDLVDISDDDCVNLVEQTLRQVQHVEKLEIGRWMMEILSSSKEDGDWIGGLPDSFIHRIISFLPSTKDGKYNELYKTWQRKWTDVIILKFISNEKLVIDSKDIPLAYLDPRLSLWIRFTARKDVKELILDCDGANVKPGHEYTLPQFLFNNFSLLKIKICACHLMPNEKVNWQNLKSMQVNHSELSNQAIEHILTGSPLLERLELHYCGFEGAVIVDSEHLKTFILEEFGSNHLLLEFSCPNLERLKIWGNLGRTSLKVTNLPIFASCLFGFLHLRIRWYQS